MDKRLTILLATLGLAAGFTVPALPHAVAAGTCQVGSGYPSIQAAVDDQACSTIVVPGGSYSATAAIGRSVTIQGAGVAQTTLLASENPVAIQVTNPNAIVVVNNVTIRPTPRGYPAPAYVGLIHNIGTLTLANVVLRDHPTSSTALVRNTGNLTVTRSQILNNDGSLFTNEGTLTVSETLFDQNGPYNSFSDRNTMIRNSAGTLVVRGSTFSNNQGDVINSSATFDSISTVRLARMLVENSTIANNHGSAITNGSVDDIAAGFQNTLRNVTIVGNGFIDTMFNTASSQINNGTSFSETQLHLANTLVAAPKGANCSGPIISAGSNLEDGRTCAFAGTGDQSAVNPLLGPLDNNGSSLPTVALLHGSPAIDAATNCPATDERGATRPFDGDTNGVATCDIGAFEYQAEPHITQANPTAIGASGPAFTLALTGENIAPGVQASWEGENRPTDLTSSNQVNVQISAADIATGKVAKLRLSLPDGRISSSFVYTVTNPLPLVTRISPPLVAQGAITTTISVLGNNFVPKSVVTINGNPTPLPTTYISTTLLRAEFPEFLLQFAETFALNVSNPAPGGGTSNLGLLRVGLSDVAGTGGGVPTVAVSGTIAYIGEGRDVSVISLQNETQPTKIGHVTAPGRVQDIEVDGQKLYATFASGFLILDISDPSNPRKLGEYRTYNNSYDISIVGNRAYLADGPNAGFKVFDVSDPADIKLLGSQKLDAYDLDVVGDLVYVATGNGPLMSYNIADPATIQLVDSYVNFRIQSLGVRVVGRRVYVTEGRDGLHIIDQASGVNYYSAYGDLGRTKDINVDGNRAYVTSFDGLLSILDVTDLANVRVLARYKTGGGSWDVRAIGNRAYLADGIGGLKVLNVQDGTTPTLIGQYTVWTPKTVEVEGNVAYTAGGTTGFQVIDLATSSAPTKRTGAATQWQAVNVAVAGSLAVVAERGTYNFDTYTEEGGGVQIFDLSAQSPALRATLPITYAQSVAIQGTTAYIGGGAELSIYNLSNPQSPQLVKTLPVSGIQAMQIQNNLLYVTVGAGIIVVDLRNPTAPVLRGSIDSESMVALRVVGNRAYTITNFRVEAYDVSDPNEIKALGLIYTAGTAQGIDVVGNRVYVAEARFDSEKGQLETIDFTNPANPTVVGRYSLDSGASGVRVVGDLIYLATGTGGLQVLRIERDLPPYSSVIALAGGSFQAPQGGPLFTFAANTFTTTVTLSYMPCDTTTLPPLGALVYDGMCYDLVAFGADGKPVAPLKPYGISVKLGMARGTNPGLYSWNTRAWVLESTSSFDVASGVLSATVSHFSTWAALDSTNIVQAPLRVFLPLMRN